MSTRIRLARHGSKKHPFYRIVAADINAPRDGRFLEQIGHYNPLSNPVDVRMDETILRKWLGRGALPTETVARLIKKAGITRAAPAAQTVEA